jgi:RNA polymerase-binding protein DksA
VETASIMSALAPDRQQRLAAALRARRAVLMEELRAELAASGEQHLVDLAGKVHDTGDESVADLIADLDAARMDRQVAELRGIQHALGRMNEGSYGQCADCSEDIGLARLEVQPAASRCVGCQDRHEHDSGRGAGPRL